MHVSEFQDHVVIMLVFSVYNVFCKWTYAPPIQPKTTVMYSPVIVNVVWSFSVTLTNELWLACFYKGASTTVATLDLNE